MVPCCSVYGAPAPALWHCNTQAVSLSLAHKRSKLWQTPSSTDLLLLGARHNGHRQAAVVCGHLGGGERGRHRGQSSALPSMHATALSTSEHTRLCLLLLPPPLLHTSILKPSHNRSTTWLHVYGMPSWAQAA